MYRVFLLGLLLFKYDLFSAQEFQDRIYRSCKAETASIARCAPNHQPDHQTFSIVNRASASTRPTTLVYSEPPFRGEVSCDIALGSNWHYRLKRKAREGYGAPINMFLKSTKTDRLNIGDHSLLVKGIYDRRANGNVGCFVITTFIKPEPVGCNNASCLPGNSRRIYCPKRISPTRRFQTQHNMRGSQESALSVNQKSGSQNLSHIRRAVFRYLHAQDRNNRLLDGLYCFDGYIFRFSPSGKCESYQQTNKYPSHGVMKLSSSSIGQQYLRE